MIFITPATNVRQAKDYYTKHMSRSDYYLKDAEEIAGEWHGRGAQLLGLSGTVDRDSYFHLCENVNPATGEKLTPRMKSARRVLYDFTFDVPKSVTLAFELGDDERILDAFRAAVLETMGEMEDAMSARVRKDGAMEDRATGNMVWAEFIHRTSRPVEGVVDPQLHCHAAAINATFDPVEQRWKAGEFGALVRDKGYYQAAFHSRLAGKLAAMGYGIERDGTSFRLAGIDETTCAEFSRRRKLIEAEAKRRGITDAEIKGKLGQWTREAKLKEPASMAELREEWLKRLKPGERDSILEARRGRESTGLNASGAVDYALSHCFERSSAVTGKRLLQTALNQSYGTASVDEVTEAAKRPGIIGRDVRGQRYVTTRAVLLEELAMIDFVRKGRGTRNLLGGYKPLELDPNLSDEQRKAALEILGSRDRVMGLNGGAGTGKTRMMRATIHAIEQTGKQVFTFAPSAEASHGVLAGEGFTNAETVERLLIDTKMQERVKGQVLWIDEAGLLSVKDMKRLFDLADALKVRVVLSGDSGQHNAVLRGDALRVLEESRVMLCASLTQNRRQLGEDYRKAVTFISKPDEVGRDGKTGLQSGLEILDSMGAIVETQGEGRYGQIARDFLAVTSQWKRKGERKTALVVSPTHAEADRVTEAIRGALKEAGRLKAAERQFTALRSRNLTQAERADPASYHAGEIVQFHQNAKGFKGGERVTVLGVESQKLGVTSDVGSGVGSLKLDVGNAKPGDSAGKTAMLDVGSQKSGVGVGTGAPVLNVGSQMLGVRPDVESWKLGVGSQELTVGTGAGGEGNTAGASVDAGSGKGRRAGERAGVMVERADGSRALLPFSEVPKFQVYRPENLSLAEGDKLRITMNGKTEERRGPLGRAVRDRLNNGAVYEVAGFTKSGDIKLANGFVVPKNYGGIAHGYVLTSHASQGKTVDVALVALGSESFAAANREQLYVSLSRGREAVKLYTDDKAAMMDAVRASSARLSATELMGDAEAGKRKRRRERERRYEEDMRRAYHDKLARLAAYDYVTDYIVNQMRKGLHHER